MLEKLLKSIFREGAMLVRAPGGKSYSVGGATSETAPLIVRIHDNATFMRIVRKPTLAVGEAYMDGTLTIERGDIYDLLALSTRNLTKGRRNRRHWWRPPSRNRRPKARRNVERHYDLTGELFRLFLDADRQYSCAYVLEPGMSLDEAQAAKKRHLAAKLLLEPGQRVLDIGSGWGGLALTLAEEHGVDVTGVTLSIEQWQDASARASERALDRHVSFDLRDYRDLRGTYDRIVSVGMFEHVGPAHYDAFFAKIAALLDPKGVAVLHTIGRFDGPGGNNPWIEKYIFPGGTIPALSEITRAVEKSGLMITDVEVLRLHYAETLRHWRQRFAANRDAVRELYDERFCRMWEFYLAGSEAGFREGDLVVFQLQMAKDRAVVPQTRDYISAFDHAPRAVRIAAE